MDGIDFGWTLRWTANRWQCWMALTSSIGSNFGKNFNWFQFLSNWAMIIRWGNFIAQSNRETTFFLTPIDLHLLFAECESKSACCPIPRLNYVVLLLFEVLTVLNNTHTTIPSYCSPAATVSIFGVNNIEWFCNFLTLYLCLRYIQNLCTVNHFGFPVSVAKKEHPHRKFDKKNLGKMADAVEKENIFLFVPNLIGK